MTHTRAQAETNCGKSPARDFVLAIIVVLIAAALGRALQSSVGSRTVSLPFVVAVALVSRYCGSGPGLAAMFLSSGLLWSCFLEPRFPISIPSLADVSSLGEFVAVCLIIWFLTLRLAAQLVAARERENALRVSEQRFRTIFEKAPMGIAATDWEGRMEQCNPALCELLGYSGAELCGLWFGSLIPAEDRDASLEQADRLRSGEIPFYDIDSRYLRRTGEPVWVRKFVSLLSDDAGGRPHILILVTDITDRKQAEQAVRQREQDLQRFIEAAPVAIAMFDSGMRYLAASQRYRDDLHLGAQELAGRSYYDVFPEIAERWRAVHRRCLSGAVERSPGEAFERFDGSEQWIRWEIQPWRRSSGAIGGLVLFTEDITRQRHAERELRESEEQFRTLANAIPQLCWMANADGWIFWYNRRWYEYTGTVPQQMEGWGWQSVHDPEMLPKVLERWSSSIDSGEPFEMVFPLRGADGEFHAFLTRVVPMRAADGSILRWFGTNTDIHEQQTAQEEIRVLNATLERRVEERTAQLRESNRELEAFSYSVSHDLRAPLRGIDGWSLALLEDHGRELNAEAREQLDRVRSETQRMGRLIDDLLQLSRITRREMQVDLVPLSKIAETVAARLIAQHHGRRIEIHVQPGMTVRGDARLLEIALTNLLSNAVKFTTPRDPGRIEVGSEPGACGTVFFVRDNGVGFDMAYAGKLFGAFQRLHKTSEFPGTGIGLATVERIVRRHGGRVWAEAEAGRGAAFYLTLEESGAEQNDSAGGR